MVRELSRVCIQALDILWELENAGISYLDIHAGNFLVTGENRHVRLVDFDPLYIRIDDNSAYTKNSFFYNMTGWIQDMGIKLGAKLPDRISSFEDAYRHIKSWNEKAA